MWSVQPERIPCSYLGGLASYVPEWVTVMRPTEATTTRRSPAAAMCTSLGRFPPPCTLRLRCPPPPCGTAWCAGGSSGESDMCDKLEFSLSIAATGVRSSRRPGDVLGVERTSIKQKHYACATWSNPSARTALPPPVLSRLVRPAFALDNPTRGVSCAS
jgi:hypothetical protein